MPKTLLLMCGPSGAGKSHWVKLFREVVKVVPINYISRDEVRFSIIKEDEDYFAHENEVFAEFIRRIQASLDAPNGNYIIADATHLTERSRNKTLDALKIPEGTKIIPVDVNPGLAKCLEQNEKRSGRAKVPRSVIRRMYNCYEPPCTTEKYKYESIFIPNKEKFWS